MLVNAIQNPLKRRFRNSFRTSSRKVREPHFLRFGLPELLLTQANLLKAYHPHFQDFQVFAVPLLDFTAFSAFRAADFPHGWVRRESAPDGHFNLKVLFALLTLFSATDHPTPDPMLHHNRF